MKKFLYKNIILYSSHQWCGNTLEYFSQHTEKLLVFLLMPRIQNKDNILRIYEKGKIVEEVPVRLSENFYLYYILWCYQFVWALLKYFKKEEKVYVITAHPYIFLGGSILKLFRNIEYVFWIADYFPPINRTMVWFEKLKKYYHDRMTYACYLGDGVNKQMNGVVMKTPYRQTIMWGVNPKNIVRKLQRIKYTLLYVGVIRETVGLYIVYRFLQRHKQYNLKVIGNCDEATYAHHMAMIQELGVSKQVYFPNRFFFDNELNTLSKECAVGLALYTTDNTNTIYYSDPGKVKAYAEMKLPIIMSKTSSIKQYVQKFHAGEAIDRTPEALFVAIKKITSHYNFYLAGLEQFNHFFYYETYYRTRFKHLEI